MEGNANRVEAERLLGIAEKLLHNRDLSGSRDFAILAQETEPLLEGTDQILAVADVLIASEKRINNHHDWYAVLQVERCSDDQELIKRHYRRLALLLHPDKNKFPLADQAFKLVADAWAVFNDRSKKALYDKELSLYDKELSLFSKVDLPAQQSKLPVRRTQRPSNKKGHQNGEGLENQRLRLSSFWTMCPYCYNLYEYPRVYEDCCLRCQSCRRGFHAALIPSLPPLVPGQEAYYCCWGVFPMGYVIGNSDNEGKSTTAAETRFPDWMPPFFPFPPPQDSAGNGDTSAQAARSESKKRGRPRKNLMHA